MYNDFNERTNENTPYPVGESHNSQPAIYSSNTLNSSQPDVQSADRQDTSFYEWNKPAVDTPPYVDETQKSKASKKGVSRGLFFTSIALCILLSFAASFLGNVFYDFINELHTSKENSNTNSLSINHAMPSNDGYLDNSSSGFTTVDIVAKTADSVVEITTESVTTGSFAQQYIQSGAGSGVIIDDNGYIVTNHHVISGVSNISITLRNGNSYNAVLVGSDESLDVALLKIEAEENLTTAVFGDSDTLLVGERIIAIGNPLGQLGGSVSEGIISALNRDVVIDDETMSLLQTDTAINPGNSGGGLFDSEGNLVGIVNAKSSGSEVEGLGFAIPINDVVDILGDLAEYGYVRGRVDLGLTFIDVDTVETAWMYGLKELGCYIYSVEQSSSAHKAGFSSADRVLAINEQQVNCCADIEKIIDTLKVGDEVVFTVKSTNGKTKDISFILEEYIPDDFNLSIFGTPQNEDDEKWWIGL